MSVSFELPLSKLRVYSIKNRQNLVQLKHFIHLTDPAVGFKKFIEGWPDLLASRNFKHLIQVIKCGLSPSNY